MLIADTGNIRRSQFVESDDSSGNIFLILGKEDTASLDALQAKVLQPLYLHSRKESMPSYSSAKAVKAKAEDMQTAYDLAVREWAARRIRVELMDIL